MIEKSAGYREIPHTADWELHVWAPDLPGLLEQSAYGMYELSNTILSSGPSVRRKFDLPYLDRESLIVDFLTELLYYGEGEKIGFNSFEVVLEKSNCRFVLTGAPIINQGKEIKAVTYHGMEVIQAESGLEVSIVFDV